MTKVTNFSDKPKSAPFNRIAVIELPVSHEHGIPVFADYLSEIQKQHDYEMHLKNAAFMFLVSKGLIKEFQQQLHAGKFRTDYQGRLNTAHSHLLQESEVCDA